MIRHRHSFTGTLALLGAVTLVGVALLGQAAGSFAQSGPAVVQAGALRIERPWARATPAGAKVGGGYLRITNTGTAPDRLKGGTTEIAERLEVHEMTSSDGIMRMRPLADGLEIGPGQTVELKPGGYHVMFMALRQPLAAGRPIRTTLEFEKAGKVELSFEVAPVGATAPAAGHGHH